MAESAAPPAQEAVAMLLARPAVANVLAWLNTEGEEARLVGGAVRNALLGLPVSDIDIATTALPQAVIARANAGGAHVVPTGIAHGTVTVITAGVPCEVTTLREDIDTDGRRAKVRFGRDFRADALRRDFTINALSASADGEIHDYAGGLTDLAERRIRFIGDADQRIREDYLRILRFFRFAATYGEGRLDPAGLAAVLRHRTGIARLSRERIRAEMMKLLAAPHALPVLGAMAEGGILGLSIDGPGDLARLARLTDVEIAHNILPTPLRRLMALALTGTDAIPALRERLRLTNREVARMEAVAPHIAPPLNAPVLLYRLGPEALRDVVLLHAAETGQNVSAALAVAERQPPAFLLSGKDVLALGIASGPAVTRILNAAERQWIAANMPPGEAEQRAILVEAARLPDRDVTP